MEFQLQAVTSKSDLVMPVLKLKRRMQTSIAKSHVVNVFTLGPVQLPCCWFQHIGQAHGIMFKPLSRAPNAKKCIECQEHPPAEKSRLREASNPKYW